MKAPSLLSLLCALLILRLRHGTQAVPTAVTRNLPQNHHKLSILHRIQSHTGSADSGTQETVYENRIQYLIRFGMKDHLLTLKKTHDLLALNFTASHYLEDGTLVSETLGHLDHCCYTGSVDGYPESSASVCTCHGLSGYITLDDDTYSVEATGQSESEFLITKHEGYKWDPKLMPNRQTRSMQSPSKKSNPQDKYNIELFLVADKAEFQHHGESLEKTRLRLMSVAHHLNQIFSKIDFQIFLVGIEIWTEENKANISESASSTLLDVLEWRRQSLLPRKHHDNMQLISGQQFKNHALGEAFFAKMCTPEHSGGIIKDPGLSPKELAKYVAHEMGHNLGMDHDTDTCYCPAASGKCLLSRRTGYNMNEMFSDCSQRFLYRFLEEKDASCLMDKPETYIDEPIRLSQTYESLETVGMVSLVLCFLVFPLMLIIIWRTSFSQRSEVKMTFSPVQTWDGHQIVSI